MKNLFFILFLLICTGTLSAQNDIEKENLFSISTQIRARGEYRNGALIPSDDGEKPAFFINNRAKLSMEYKRSNHLQLKLSAQHVGVWGQDPQIDKNGRFILHEAWGRINFGYNKFFVQFGRFGLSYDDERILGELDWNVAGRFHDALRVGFEEKEHKVHFIGAFNQNDEKIFGGTFYMSGAQPYKNMQTLWYQYTPSVIPFKVSLLAMNLGFEKGDPETQVADNYYIQTFGTNLSYSYQRWKFSASGYYQSGKTKTNRVVSAFLANVDISFKITDLWAVNAGFDYLSGNKNNEGTYTAFDPLYGTHHKFYGAMDYFYASAFKPGYAPGLTDSRIGVTYNTSKKVNMSLHYHYFTTGEKLPELNMGLGSEIDYQININIIKDVNLSAGYSFMIGSKTMDVVKGGNHKLWQDWAWVSININPQIFKFNW